MALRHLLRLLDLTTLQLFLREKWRCQIGPQRLAGEICDMKLVPWRLDRLPGKSRPRILATFHNLPIQSLEGNAIGYEHTAQTRCGERRDRQLFGVRFNQQSLI